MQNALDRILLDPMVASASLNQKIQIAALPEMPITIHSAVKVSGAPIASASDAWSAPNNMAVKLTWKKPTNRISGKLAGFKIQVLASGGVWRTLVNRTSASARSYTLNGSTYLNAGVSATFRLAAVSYYARKYYTGKFRTISAIPTSLPVANTRIQVQNATTEIRYSWAPLTYTTDMGGSPVTYSLSVSSGGSQLSCASTTLTTCVITPATIGATYTAVLVITNNRGSATTSTVSTIFTSASLPVTTNDTWFNNQWHLKSDSANPYGMKVTNAWATESGAPNVYVAVVDTGITDHPDLNSNVVAGYDFVSDPTSANDGGGWDSNPSDPGDWDHENADPNARHDSSWHGTHVSGMIAAADNAIGVIGVAPNVKIIPVRVLGKNGGTESDIVAGLNWAAGIPIDGVPTNPTPANVINMSIGGQSPCNTGSPTQLALVAIKARGITVVTAAGNDGSFASYSYPGNCYPTINVAATGKTGFPTFYSNFGDATDVAAPGGDYCYQVGAQDSNGQIYSTLNSGATGPEDPNYGWELGTSMASPNVAGVVALMYSALLRKSPTVARNGDLVQRMWTALSSNLTPLAGNVPPATPQGHSCVTDPSATAQRYGDGLVNAEAALAAILR
jgi:subtilisin family serine protease